MTLPHAPAAFILAAALALAGCGPRGRNVPGDSSDRHPFADIAADETVRFTGTEPFWGGEVTGRSLLWKTPDRPEGEGISVARFAGRGGLSFSGTLAGEDLMLIVTPGDCSDGMSDRVYPFVAIVRIGAAQRQGCAWTDAHPHAEGGGG